MIRICSTLLLSFVIFSLFLLGPVAVTPAEARQPSDKGLAFSVDGKAYSVAPPEMFSQIPILVPGDRITEALWIRNERDSKIEVNVEPDIQTEQSEVYFRTDGASTFVLYPGQSTKVVLQLGLPFASTNRSEGLVENSARVIIRAAETLNAENPDQNPSVPPVESGNPPKKYPEVHYPDSNVPEDQKNLSDTGFGGWIFPMALGTLAAGIAILYSSGRRENTETLTDGDNR